jgi:rhomboid protease GluP
LNDTATSPRPATESNPFLLTQVIVGINVLVFLGMVLSGVSPMSPTFEQLKMWGANYAPLSLGSQPWRMLASNYVHIGIIHIFFNMWCLWNLGRLAERIFDRWTYLLVYTASGIAGSLASLWVHPRGVGAGASGAIFGLAGGLIAVLYLGKLPIAKEALKPTLKSLLSFAAYNLFFGLVPGIDNSAHLGGLAAGLALGAVLAASVTQPPDVRASRRNYVLLATVLLLLAGYSYVKQKSGPVRLRSRAPCHPDRSERSERSGEPALRELRVRTRGTRLKPTDLRPGRARVHSCRQVATLGALWRLRAAVPETSAPQRLKPRPPEACCGTT